MAVSITCLYASHGIWYPSHSWIHQMAAFISWCIHHMAAFISQCIRHILYSSHVCPQHSCIIQLLFSMKERYTTFDQEDTTLQYLTVPHVNIKCVIYRQSLFIQLCSTVVSLNFICKRVCCPLMIFHSSSCLLTYKIMLLSFL